MREEKKREERREGKEREREREERLGGEEQEKRGVVVNPFAPQFAHHFFLF